MADSKDRMLRAALRYAAIGWYVFPLASKGDIKTPHPMLGRAAKGETRGHTHASIDPKQITTWWTKDPEAGIGLWVAKSGLFVADIDPRHGGPATIDALESENGPLLTSVISETGGGGWHRFFEAPAGLQSAPGRLGPKGGGVDVKFNGYVILPPSMHPDGKRYRWADGCRPDPDNLGMLPIAPDWTLTSSSRELVPAGKAAADDSEDWSDEDVQGPIDVTFDQVKEALLLVPNDGADEMEYEEWVEVLMAVYHQTEGSAEGEEIAREWSEQADKHTDEEFDKTWRSLDHEGKGRRPITFRHVLKLAKPFRAAAAVRVRDDFEVQIKAAESLVELKAVFPAIKLTEMDGLTRDDLAKVIGKKYRELSGNPPSPSEIRRQIRFERDDAELETPKWLKGWVYCTQDNKFHKRHTATLIDTRAFNNSQNRNLLSAQDIRERKLVPDYQASDVALNLYETPTVYGRMYLPGEDDFFTYNGAKWVNTFTARRQPKVPAKLSAENLAAIARVEAHFTMLFPDPRERGLILSWFSHIVQTQTRPNWAVCVQGPEGIGKSFFVPLMGCVLGSDNVNMLIASTIQESQFNSWAEGVLLNVIDEVKQHAKNRHIVLDRLQPLITNDAISIHKKNLSPYTAVNTAGYLLLTNHKDALPVSAEDTRYFIVSTEMQNKKEVREFKRQNPTYYSNLFECLNEHAGAIRGWFLDYTPHPQFNAKARAPWSDGHRFAAASSKNEYQDALEEILDEDTAGLNRVLLDSVLLSDLIGERTDSVPTSRELGWVIRSQGFDLLGRFMIDGRRSYFWSTKPKQYGRTTQARRAKITEVLNLDI